MANQEHLDILKQGVEIWNEWREKHPDVEIDLLQADLNGVNLSYASLSDAKLTLAQLSGADLSGATLHGADLRYATLSSTDLSGANLSGADLEAAHLRDANLSGALLIAANLYNANLYEANLYDASLESADLSYAILSSADLDFADLNWATLRSVTLGSTIFGDVDLSAVEGLETVRHEAPSTIGIDTIIRSKGKIPKEFLREAGVPDSIIKAIPSLVGSLSPIDYFSCFISYSSKDQDFAEHLHDDLLAEGVRCWYAPEDMKIGDKIRPRIDEAIRIHDKLLLVLSENSVTSDWVEKEVETAFEKERQQQKLVLFPIRLDNTVMQTTQAWAADIRRSRHIGDFRDWKSHNDYLRAFSRLLRDLKA